MEYSLLSHAANLNNSSLTRSLVFVHLNAKVHTPSATACGFGSVTDFSPRTNLVYTCLGREKNMDVSAVAQHAQGNIEVHFFKNILYVFSVCSFTDCSTAQHLIFLVPDYVVEATATPPAHPTEASNVLCTLHKLTSDPNICIVPLEGCAINKYVRHTSALCAPHNGDLKVMLCECNVTKK